MKERPILFNGEMVRAILDGRKTQTRRVVKLNHSGRIQYRGKQWHPEDKSVVDGSPYGQPSDLLWVRETWGIGTRPHPYEGWVDGIEYRADEGFITSEYDELPLYPIPDDAPGGEVEKATNKESWIPSIHMPRWASRINLRVTNVRVERVQEIGHTDALAEGCDLIGWPENLPMPAGFAGLWDSINAKRGYGWDVNPWVWVVSFELDDNHES